MRKESDESNKYSSMIVTIGKLKSTINDLEKRINKAESLINLIYYEANPAYLTGLKIKYEKEYGEIDEKNIAK